MSNPVLALIAVIAIASASLVGLVAYQGSKTESVQGWTCPGQVSEYTVIDGDTFRCADGSATIRISNIDTPEIRKPRHAAEKELGLKAKAELARILALGKVEISPEMVRRKDGTLAQKSEKYGRTLARVRVGGRDVGEMLIEKGLARPYSGGKREPWPEAASRSKAPAMLTPTGSTGNPSLGRTGQLFLLRKGLRPGDGKRISATA